MPVESPQDRLAEIIQEQNPEALTADGLDDAILGIAYRAGAAPLVAYSTSQCIQILMDRDGMSHDEASEFFEFNIVGAFVGPGTPVFVQQRDEILAF
jgi:hypothetical protein